MQTLMVTLKTLGTSDRRCKETQKPPTDWEKHSETEHYSKHLRTLWGAFDSEQRTQILQRPSAFTWAAQFPLRRPVVQRKLLRTAARPLPSHTCTLWGCRDEEERTLRPRGLSVCVCERETMAPPAGWRLNIKGDKVSLRDCKYIFYLKWESNIFQLPAAFFLFSFSQFISHAHTYMHKYLPGKVWNKMQWFTEQTITSFVVFMGKGNKAIAWVGTFR